MVSVDPSTRLLHGLPHPADTSTHLFLVRHGQTAGNVNHQLIGHTDLPLDDIGHRQAHDVGHSMRTLRLDAILASPLRRARDTATRIARHHGLEVDIDHRLVEMHFGHAEGLTIPEAAARVPDELSILRDDPLSESFGWPGGDVRARFHSRVMDTFADLVTRFAGRHVAIVSHGGVITSLMARLQGGSPDDFTAFAFANCSLTHIEVRRDGTWAHCINRIDHLREVLTEPFAAISPDALASAEMARK